MLLENAFDQLGNLKKQFPEIKTITFYRVDHIVIDLPEKQTIRCFKSATELLEWCEENLKKEI